MKRAQNGSTSLKPHHTQLCSYFPIVLFSNEFLTLFDHFFLYFSKSTKKERAVIVVDDKMVIGFLQTLLAQRLQSHLLFGTEFIVLDDYLLLERKKREELYLFGLSCMQKEQHDYFLSLSQSITVYWFLFSPCMMFWGDIYSDRQIRNMPIQSDQLYDRCPILANLAQAAKSYATTIQETFSEFQEAYILDDSRQNPRPDVCMQMARRPSTTFQTIQTDILLLEKPVVQKCDDSIQVHGFSSLYGEVKYLFDYLSKLSGPFNPAEIVILAPNIEIYRPYIERFKKDSVPFQFASTNQIASDGLVQAVYAFFHLFSGRFEAHHLLLLLDFRSVRKKIGIEKEHIAVIKKTIEEFHFYSGAKAFTRYKKYFFDAFQKEGLFSLDEAEAIACFIAFVESVQLLYQELGVKTIKQWVLFTEELLQSYCLLSKKDEKEYQLLTEALYKVDGDLVTAAGFCDLLQVEVTKEQERCDVVSMFPIVCASLGSYRITPKKVVCFLGMQEGHYPKKLGDGYIFLQTFLSADTACYISYQNYSYAEHNKNLISTVLVDLVQGYGITVFQHEIDPELDECEKQEISSTFFSPTALEVKKRETLFIQTLSQFARSPLQPYLKTQLGISFYNAENEAFDDEFSNVSKKGIRKHVLDHVLKKNQGIDPFSHLPSSFQEAIGHIVKNEKEELYKAFLDLEISFESLFTVTPSFVAKDVMVTGAIDMVCEKGIVSFGKKSIQECVKLWPKLLLIACTQKEIDTSILFLESGNKASFIIEDPLQELLTFIHYYEKSKCEPLLVYPEQIEQYFRHEEMPKQFCSVSTHGYVDPYFAFFVKKETKEMIEKKWPQWRQDANTLYSTVLEGVR